MNTRRITSAGPSITQAEIELVTEAITDGWQDKMTWYIDQFVNEFSDYIGIKYCLPTAHCTDAIHLAMLALDIGPGDEVIVPDLTWVASVSPVCYVGAHPVFADVDRDSWCITAESISKCITPKTKAVVVVDLLGNMPEWDDIITLCRSKNIKIIEDAAEGIGAKYKGKQAGSFGDISLFSFNATKLIMSGQGGAVCTNDPDLYKKVKLFSHHGIDKVESGKYYWSTVIGYNYNWTNIQAALALAQLRRIDELISYKKWLFEEYTKGLKSIPGLRLNSATRDVNPVYWITTVIVDQKYGLNKEEIIEKFIKYKIDIRPLFYPISSMPPFEKYSHSVSVGDNNIESYELSNYGVCLPNGNNLTSEDVSYICASFKKVLALD
ncbi:DegT/DnrJ/EryC1/StrS family aminotransferase [Pseudomonadales bacterium]|nr:DegT/DnrJ/EryC1/StrS family aminotransferase [Pseudomonadales bacterium]